MRISIEIVFKLKENSSIRGYKAALAKTYCRLDVKTYVMSQRTINEWHKLSHDCINASSVNIMFINKIDSYLPRAGYTLVEHLLFYKLF